LKIENKLLLYIFLIPLIGMIIGMSGGLYLIKYSFNLSKDEGAIFLKQREITLQKDKLKLIVENVIHDISSLKLNEKNYIQKIKEIYPPRKNSYIFIYKLYKFEGGQNFAKMVVNSNRPDIEGKLVSDTYKDIKGFEFRKKMLSLIRRDGEGFVTYYYKKPNSSKIAQKITYFKYYRPLNIIIASGLYLDDIQNIINNYKNHLDKFYKIIITKFIFISFIIFFIVVIFTYFISKILLKEFSKFKKTIALNEKKLRYKLYLDELTKLKSRKSLVEAIEKEKFDCFILIDIDNFKTINQFFGAEIGDTYLKEFANLLKKFKKQQTNSISLYRLGADEFCITIKHSYYLKTKELAENLYEFLTSQKIKIDDEEFDVDATIVCSDFPNPLKKALITLAEAKENHISLMSYFDLKNKDKQKQLFETKKMLKTAIENRQIIPYAQAIVNEKQEIIKYELLMRIKHENKIIPPYFLEDAKRLKLYTKLSSIMLDKCFEFIKNTDILCSINIDMQDIQNETIVKKLRDYITTIKKPVVFEILESESFHNYDIIKNFINEFRKYKVLFAIDDFGSGYSNYSEVINLKPDYLKIDGSLIKNIVTSKDNLIIIDSILFITKMIGIKTTAEFVENEEIFNKLRALGIDEFQGYYFDKPKSIEEIK